MSDRDVWIYGQTLRKISEKFGFTHVHFIRLRDLLGIDVSEPLTEESYIDQAPHFRDKLTEIHTPVGLDLRHDIANNEDSAATYRGYIRFLAKDLANTKKYETKTSKSAIKKRNEMVARRMMGRGKVSLRFIVDICAPTNTCSGVCCCCPGQLREPCPSLNPPFFWKHQVLDLPVPPH